ncbi:MAG: 50S ribosomal protein L32 [Gemmatimonadetes bacterium]|jgi:large subunit ribosomal protein L32|nr:50S ribosomal protein L32 [Gemmatimonadota bacterium]MBT7859954.1 50S ribosomal protein L32 [Gemmatimonadota bacterium]
MAAVPKRRISRTRRDKRRTHWKLKVTARSTCPQCGAANRPHTVCKSCGTYRGRTYQEPAD